MQGIDLQVRNNY